MSRQRTIAACHDSVERGLYYDRLPPRSLEPKAIELWKLADTLSTAEAHELAGLGTAMMEAREKLDLAIRTLVEQS